MSAYITDNQNHLTLQLIKINPKNKLKKYAKLLFNTESNGDGYNVINNFLFSITSSYRFQTDDYYQIQ